MFLNAAARSHSCQNVRNWLCRQRVPVGAPILSHVDPFPINDEMPTECEIRKAAGRMKHNKAPGQTRVHNKDFKDCLVAGSMHT